MHLYNIVTRAHWHRQSGCTNVLPIFSCGVPSPTEGWIRPEWFEVVARDNLWKRSSVRLSQLHRSFGDKRLKRFVCSISPFQCESIEWGIEWGVIFIIIIASTGEPYNNLRTVASHKTVFKADRNLRCLHLGNHQASNRRHHIITPPYCPYYGTPGGTALNNASAFHPQPPRACRSLRLVRRQVSPKTPINLSTLTTAVFVKRYVTCLQSTQISASFDSHREIKS